MDQWHYSANGKEKLGPVGFNELAQTIVGDGLDPETTLIWQRGMSEWLPASEREDLMQLTQELTDTVSAADVPGMSEEEMRAEMRKIVEKAENRAEAEQSSDAQDAPPPLPAPKKAPFWPYVVLFGTVIFYYISRIAPVLMEKVGNRQMSPDELTNELKSLFATEEFATLMLPLILLGLAWQVYSAFLVYRAWQRISLHVQKPTPLLAAALIPIPIINLFWRFIACRQWAVSWNAINVNRPQILPLPVGLYTAHFICFVLASVFLPIAFVALVLDFIVMRQMSDAASRDYSELRPEA